MNTISQLETDFDRLNEEARAKQFLDAGLVVPEYGLKYLCQTVHGGTRVLRYGYHRKNNSDIWSKPAVGQRPNLLWVGWRDDENWRFIRFDEVTSIQPIYQPCLSVR